MNSAVKGIIAIIYFIFMSTLIFFVNSILIAPIIDEFFNPNDPNIGWVNVTAKAVSLLLYIVILFVVPYFLVTEEE